MNMNPSRGKISEGRGTSGPDETSERYYMNKAFGRSMESAKALDRQPGRPQEQPSEVQRATIEPDRRGGHMVTIERLLQVTGSGREARRTEHWFPEVESAIQFLHHLLSGDRTEGSTAGERDYGQAEKNQNLPEPNEAPGSRDRAIFSDMMGAA
jgi:hypothetical protein